MTPDSTLIAQRWSPGFFGNYPDPASVRHEFRFQHLKSDGNNFIIRLSSPDYKTVCYDINPSTIDFNAGTLKIRKLTNFEKALMLGEVTVTASVVAFVNKGDTVQYNADAFQVAQGSMLDALIEQMPGVELRDNGQIFVNGRFVDKLLLDGKDFFKNDQLVLLQNLPAYTVKNIKVYEKREGATAVLGKGAMDLSNRDKYVMDVTLKKDYNTGWIANAEAGGGTHNRYRGRAFGLGYTQKLRLGAYGFINNINETRRPERGGNWTPADTRNGITASKGGGIDYGIYKSDNSVELNGSVETAYTHTDRNSTVDFQNFLDNGDTYGRRWDEALQKKLLLSTNHAIDIRPAQGNNYEHHIEISAEYNNDRNRRQITEGVFGSPLTRTEGLKEQLRDSLPSDNDPINRYLNYIAGREKHFEAAWYQNSTIAIPGTSNGFSIRSDGYYMTGNSHADNDYLLQYDPSSANETRRHNPRKNHSYKYWIGLTGNFRLNSHLYLSPFYAFSHRYDYNSNTWMTDRPELALSPAMVREAAMRLDPRNSYNTRFSHTHHLISTIFSYETASERDGETLSTLNMYIQPGMNVISRRLSFYGIDRQIIKRNYVSPECSFSINGFLSGMAPYLYADYNISGIDADMMDMVDITFDSDPLNPRRGNPGLKNGISHTANIGYQSKKMLFGRLIIDAKASCRFSTNDMTYAYDYDREAGISTYFPMNVSGNKEFSFRLNHNMNLSRDSRRRRFMWINNFEIGSSRIARITSDDNFTTLDRSNLNSLSIKQAMRLQYGIGRYTQVGLEGSLNTLHTTAAQTSFTPFTIYDFSYGPTLRTMLPWEIEVSTNIKMFSTRGYDNSAMNTNQLVWNGRISKSLMKGSLIVYIDGYDILGNVKTITHSLSAQKLTETWTESIPSYAMLSLRWNFAKKPRE